MAFVAIQRDALVRDILFNLPECDTEFTALGADIAEAVKTDLTLEQLCCQFQVDTDEFIVLLRARLDDLA